MTIDEKDTICVADRSNHRIQCFDSEGNFLLKFGIEGTGKGEFKFPTDVAFDSKNQRILVVDKKNHRIQAFNPRGTFLFTFGTKGEGNGEFNEPWGIATDQAGSIFVSDTNNHRVQVFDEKGNFLRKFGSYGSGQGELMWPIGIGVLSNGGVAVAELLAREGGNKRLSVFNAQGQFIQFIGEGKLKNPLWLFIDSSDNILVADNFGGNESLLIFSKEGILLKQIGQGCFNDAWGAVMNRKGDTFASGRGKDGQHRIFVF